MCVCVCVHFSSSNQVYNLSHKFVILSGMMKKVQEFEPCELYSNNNNHSKLVHVYVGMVMLVL